MKKLIINIVLFFAVMGCLQAQTFQWAKSAGSHLATCDAFGETVCNICTDSAGNVYYGVRINGYREIMIGDSAAFMPDIGWSDLGAAILCYDCHGELQWYKMFYSKKCRAYNSNGEVILASMNLLNDTTLLISLCSDVWDTLMACDGDGKIDTIHDEEKGTMIWMNTRTREIMQFRNYPVMDQIQIAADKIYNTYGVGDTYGISEYGQFVDVYDIQGNILSHTKVKIAIDLYNGDTIRGFNYDQFDYQVYNNKYYYLFTGYNKPVYIGDDTIPASSGTYLACSDSTGECLWYLLWSTDKMLSVPYGHNLDIDREKGIIYIAQSAFVDDTVAGEAMHEPAEFVAFGAYDTLGNKLFFKHGTGDGNSQVWGLTVLSGGRVAIGGNCRGYQTIGGVDNDTLSSAFLCLYDGNTNRFILEATGYCSSIYGAGFSTFCMDNEDNLLFGGRLSSNTHAVFGNDTLRSRSNKYNSFFGKYGWPCGTQADWPDPVSIAPIFAAAPETQIKLYPNPTTDGVWVVYEAGPDDHCQLRIRNVLGQELIATAVAADGSPLYLSLKRLSAGAYMIEYCKNGQVMAVQKLIKK